jgi:hypothetical protein
LFSDHGFKKYVVQKIEWAINNWTSRIEGAESPPKAPDKKIMPPKLIEFWKETETEWKEAHKAIIEGIFGTWEIKSPDGKHDVIATDFVSEILIADSNFLYQSSDMNAYYEKQPQAKAPKNSSPNYLKIWEKTQKHIKEQHDEIIKKVRIEEQQYRDFLAVLKQDKELETFVSSELERRARLSAFKANRDKGFLNEWEML